MKTRAPTRMDDAENKALGAVSSEINRFSERLDAYYHKFLSGEGPHPIERGAMMRASMDLTRALAQLRKPR